MLLSLVAVGLSRAKTRAWPAECIGNVRQLMIAWTKHPSDNDDALVLNYRARANTNDPPPLPWVQGDYHYDYDSVTNADFLTDPKLAAFAGAVPNPKIYRRPAVRHDIRGVPISRSFGLNQYMGAGSQSDTVPGFATFTRLADVANPANTFTFLELNPHTICTSMARVPVDTNQATGFFHLPSFLHGGRAVIAFTDGHVDLYGVRDKDSLRDYPVDWIADHQFATTNADVLALRELTTTPQ